MTARLEDPKSVTSQHSCSLFEYCTWCVLLITEESNKTNKSFVCFVTRITNTAEIFVQLMAKTVPVVMDEIVLRRQIHQAHDKDYGQTDLENDVGLKANASFATPIIHEPNYTLHAVGKSQLTALLRINSTNVRFQLDTGTDINTINKRFCEV